MIEQFYFEDMKKKWSFSGSEKSTTNEFPATFNMLSLLVGLSGVGKTRILKALFFAVNKGLGESPSFNLKWILTIRFHEHLYIWKVQTNHEPSEDSYLSAIFFKESLTCDEKTIVKRKENGEIFLDGQNLMGIKTTESIISIFSKNPMIQPFFNALHRIKFIKAGYYSGKSSSLIYLLKRRQFFSNELKTCANNITKLRESKASLVMKAAALQQFYPDEFKELCEEYYEIFPAVTELRFGKLTEFEQLPAEYSKDDFQNLVVAAIKEKNVPKWITTLDFSSGMRDTLIYLLELYLVPDDSVLLIDELENSLGVNCLGSVTNALKNTKRNIQIIATSHHPYIINKISVKNWSIVQRKGGKVYLIPSQQITRLQTESYQEHFIQLLNTNEYQEGIS